MSGTDVSQHDVPTLKRSKTASGIVSLCDTGTVVTENDDDPNWWRKDTVTQSLVKMSVADSWASGYEQEQENFNSFALFSEVSYSLQRLLSVGRQV